MRARAFFAGMFAAVALPAWFYYGAWMVMNPCGLKTHQCDLRLGLEALTLLMWLLVGATGTMLTFLIWPKESE